MRYAFRPEGEIETVSVSEERVQVGKRGTLTLPVGLRKRYGLDAGDLLTVMDLGGVFVLSPEVSVVSKIAREIQQMREEAGISPDELLAGLDEQRKRFYREKYGSPA
jgi:bifunctional DNA-binding transcriptional regulator/antitoxin component of YhaV-PrlF toxin-antitoxin module